MQQQKLFIELNGDNVRIHLDEICSEWILNEFVLARMRPCCNLS